MIVPVKHNARGLNPTIGGQSILNANVQNTRYFRVYYQYGQFELYLLTNNWKYFLLTTERLTCVTVNNLLWNEFLYLAAILWLCKPFTLHLLCCLCLQTVLDWVRRTIQNSVRHQSSFSVLKFCRVHWFDESIWEVCGMKWSVCNYKLPVMKW